MTGKTELGPGTFKHKFIRGSMRAVAGDTITGLYRRMGVLLVILAVMAAVAKFFTFLLEQNLGAGWTVAQLALTLGKWQVLILG